MIEINEELKAALEEFEKTMQWSSEYLTKFLNRDSEKRLLVFYSLGLLSDNYLSSSEEALKQGEGYQATYFTNKAEEIRTIVREVFGGVPEKDYYRSLPFKIPHWYKGSMKPEQVLQLAQFCVSNLHPEEEVMQDEKLLYSTIRGMFKAHRHAFEDPSGLGAHFTSVLRERFKELADKPPKLGGIYEIMLLLDVVNQVLEMVKNPPEEENEEEEEEEDPDFEPYELEERSKIFSSIEEEQKSDKKEE